MSFQLTLGKRLDFLFLYERRTDSLRGPALASRAAKEQDAKNHLQPALGANMPSATLDKILDLFEHRSRAGGGWVVSCPVLSHGKGNGDRNPSLSITEKDGRVLLNCQSGCHTQDVLIAVGLDWPDLFDEPIADERGVKVAEWIYTRTDGTPYSIQERWQTPTGKKFIQRIPGNDRAGLPDKFKPVLYRVPQVVAAAKAGEEIWICEGEKCAHALTSLGVTATTPPGGVNGWRPYMVTWLKGAGRINIVADNDEPGQRYAAQIEAEMRAAQIPVQSWKIALPFPKADIFDHIMAGYGLADLTKVKLNRVRPTGMTGAALMKAEFPDVTWAVPDLLPAGMALLGGPPKVGKSEIALDIAISVASDNLVLGNWEPCQGSVLFLALDNDSMQRTQARVDALGRVRNMDCTDLPIEFHAEFPTGDEAILCCREWVADERDAGRKPTLIVADTLARIEPNFEGNGQESAYLRSTDVLSRWAKMATDLNVCLLAVHHDRKMGDGDWVNRFSGSRGLTAACHTLMMLDAKRGESEGKLRVAGRDVVTDDYDLQLYGGWRWSTHEPLRVVR